MNFIKKCDKCQRFAEGYKAPPEMLHTMASPWPFYRWGVDILGPFPLAPGQIKILIVAVDYFTKWIEAEPVAAISTEKVKKFLWKKIICRFGLPATIVSDNGTQFASKTIVEFCHGLGIKQIFTSVEHPQTNGQAEAANKVIMRGLRRRLEEAKGWWVEELPQVLWSYHTTPHSSANETPFRLAFGTEAVILVEIGEPSLRTEFWEPEANAIELRANLDMMQEVREAVHIREFTIKARVAKLYNRKVIPCNFKPQDLVLRRTVHKVESNKLTPKWEGPFRVKKEVGRGAYKLETLKGKEIPRTWNAASMRIHGFASDKVLNGNSTKLTMDSTQISPVRATYTVGHGFASDKVLNGNSTKLTMDSTRISPVRTTYTAGQGFAAHKSQNRNSTKLTMGSTRI
ncbi:Tf2-9, partial [Mucuna pruriens]